MHICRHYHNQFSLLELLSVDYCLGKCEKLLLNIILSHDTFDFFITSRYIADHFGRIPALAGCNIIGFVAGVATAFVGNFWQFSVCRFFVGFAFDNCFTMMYILGEKMHLIMGYCTECI